MLLDSVYKDMYKIYIGNKIRNLTRFYDDSYYIASHKTSTIFWGYVKNTRSAENLRMSIILSGIMSIWMMMLTFFLECAIC